MEQVIFFKQSEDSYFPDMGYFYPDLEICESTIIAIPETFEKIRENWEQIAGAVFNVQCKAKRIYICGDVLGGFWWLLSSWLSDSKTEFVYLQDGEKWDLFFTKKESGAKNE